MKKFLRVFLIFFTIIFLTILSISLYLGIKYSNWQKDFERSMQSRYTISSETIEQVDIEEEITHFILSSENTEFLELKLVEVGSLLFAVLDYYVGSDVTLETMYIQPEYGKWMIYLKVRYMDISGWISFDINKDNMQTAQLYTTDILVGPFSIKRYGNWVDLINKGIADSIVTLNENGFVGRYLENIELLEDRVVIKGSRY